MHTLCLFAFGSLWGREKGVDKGCEEGGGKREGRMEWVQAAGCWLLLAAAAAAAALEDTVSSDAAELCTQMCEGSAENWRLTC